jgi:carbon monoxide dehydrogenase subunit G
MSVTINGAKTIRADRDRVWAALNDVDILKLCIAGCQALTRVSSSRFDVVVGVALGPVRITFRGSILVSESAPPVSYRLSGRGEGGLAGIAVGSALIRLTDVPEGCRLAYAIEAEPGSRLAALGAVFVSGIARTLADRFAVSFAAHLEQIEATAIVAAARPAV